MKLCSACGGSIDPAQTALPPSSFQSGPTGTGGQGGMAPNIAAMLTYLPVCFVGLVCAVLFAFVLEPYKSNRFVRFHAWQSLAVHALWFVVSIAWFIFSFVLSSIARFIGLIAAPFSMLLGLGGLVLMIILMVKAYGNHQFKLPMIGDWAEKQANG